MFGRNKVDHSEPAAAAPPVPPRPGAKNRPTPTRREAEAARRQPLIPEDRKAAARHAKAKARQDRARAREAALRGEEWALLQRDKGKQRAFVRDYLDSRRGIAEFALPLMIIGMPLSIVQANLNVAVIGYLIIYAVFFFSIAEILIRWLQLRSAIPQRFGEPMSRGTFLYIAARAMQLRFTRNPRPRVARGQRDY